MCDIKQERKQIYVGLKTYNDKVTVFISILLTASTIYVLRL